MKDIRTSFQTIKKILIVLFCVITVSMNIINYLQNNASKQLGTVYQWQSVKTTIDTSTESDSLSVNENQAEANVDSVIININTADSEELQKIKGIGPTKANAIIEYRNSYGSFLALEEIMEVPGIGEGIYSKIKDYICLE